MFVPRHRLQLFSLPALLLCSFCYISDQATNTPQKQARPVIESAVYEKTLDLLFSGGESVRHNEISIAVLRFEPTFASESEVVLKETALTHEILFYTVSDGNAYQRLNELVQSGTPQQVEPLARKIAISVKTVSVPTALFQKWNSAMFENLRLSTESIKALADQQRSGTVSFPVDGTVYRLKYHQGTTDICVKLYDVDGDRTSSSPQFKLVQWMNSVRDYVTSH